MISQKFNNAERIVHYLMLNSYFINDMGLWYGQMGVALAISSYARYTNNQIYLDATSFLLSNIMKNINHCRTLSFSSGILGIGWGIEHLLQQEFIEGEGIDICESIDRSIMEISPNRILDLSLENGIMGLLHYVIYHLQGALKTGSELPFDEEYFSELHKLCIALKKLDNPNSLNLLLDIYINFYHYRSISNYNISITNFIKINSEKLQKKLSFYPIGLRSGLAGILLNIINKKNESNEKYLYI